MLKGGTQILGVVFTWYLEILAILKGGGGATVSALLKGWRKKLCTVLRGDAKSFGLSILWPHPAP